MLGSVSEQMPGAGVAAGYTPWRSSCRAKDRHWNKGRGPSPSCSMGRVMNLSQHELTALCDHRLDEGSSRWHQLPVVHANSQSWQ